jgi:epoxyqueuosine reductase
VALAAKAGLGWRGKHTLLLDRDAGSYFFLGEIYTDLPLPTTSPTTEHCGSCTRCIAACPTGAIIGPYRVDARRCISYLTIEHPGSIPEDLRPLMGNRLYGCDDCQLVCPWNKYAQVSTEPDFEVRNGLDDAGLVQLFGWTESQFEERLAGSAIRRIGHERWLRNIAVALGNAPSTPAVSAALRNRADDASPMVREHVKWALERHAG